MEKTNRLVVADSGWAETLPEWLLQEIRDERMVGGLCAMSKGEKDQGVGDAEVVAYLYTLSLKAPISRDMSEIYLSLSSKLLRKRGMPAPEHGGLDKSQEHELAVLRQELKRLRGKVSHPILDALRELGKRAPQKKKRVA